MVIKIGVLVDNSYQLKIKQKIYFVWTQIKFLLIILKVIKVSFIYVRKMEDRQFKNTKFSINETVTNSEDFELICLFKSVFKTTSSSALKNMRCNSIIEVSSCDNR